ncbi:hypothetical protein ACOY5Z_26040, partial [Escherichia coli]
EREPIHIPGSIQPNAVMLAADAGTLEILAHSTNVRDVLSRAPERIAGLPLAEVLPTAFVETIRQRLASATLDDGRSIRRTLKL